MSLFHLIKSRTRREQPTITNVQDPIGLTQTLTKGTVDAFRSFLRTKYGPIPVDDECVRNMAEAGHQRLSDEWNEALDMPITPEEVQSAVNKGEGTRRLEETAYALSYSKQPWELRKAIC
jgi:hypothetical protein